jgi:hypothetical protein
MPCSGDGYVLLSDKQKDLGAALCAVLSVLERDVSLAAVFDRADWTEAGVTREWVEHWWESHKRADEERRHHYARAFATGRPGGR